MTSRCPYIYTTDGVRIGYADVVAQVLIDGAETAMEFKYAERLLAKGGVTLLRFYLQIEDTQVDLEINMKACHGRAGRRTPNTRILDEVSIKHGKEAAHNAAMKLISYLPGAAKDSVVGESRSKSLAALKAYSGYVNGGLAAAVAQNPHTAKLYEKELIALNKESVAGVLNYGGKIHVDAKNCVALYESVMLSDWIIAALADDERSRFALFVRGEKMPPELLESVIFWHSRDVTRCAAMYALAKSSPEVARRVADEMILKAIKSELSISDRMAEAAIQSASPVLVSKIASNVNLPWMWCAAAVASLPDDQQEVFSRTALEKKSHPLVRLAATARLRNEYDLSQLTGDKNTAVAECAVRSLGQREITTRPEAVVRTRHVMEGDPTRIRLLAIDLDGTMLDDRGGNVASNMEGVRRFIDNGGTVCFTTTRSMERTLLLVQEALDGRRGVVVCDEGYTVCDAQTGIPLRQSSVPVSQESGADFVRFDLPAHEFVSSAKLSYGELYGLEVVGDSSHSCVVRLGTGKHHTLDYVVALTGVSFDQCAVVGDGKVDIPMFERVTNAGGIAFAVANAQPGVIDHPAVGVVCSANTEGGVKHVVDVLHSGLLPDFSSDEQQQANRARKKESYSQYVIEDGFKLRESIRNAGLGDLVAGGHGVQHFGGTPSNPGHVTHAHPNDWRDRKMPQINKEAEVWAVGWVKDEAGTSIICGVGGAEEEHTVRPDGSLYHVTLTTRMGLPPMITNVLLKKGWHRLSKPFKIDVRAVESSRFK